MQTTGTIESELHLALEVPLNQREARARDLPLDVGRLVVGTRHRGIDRSRALEMYARIIHWWRGPDETAYLVPINVFLDQPALRRLVDNLGLREVRVGEDYGLACSCEAALAVALQRLDCEELAIFFACDDDAARDVLSAVAAYKGPGASHNAQFLQAKSGRQGFVFYASSHLSIEVLGTLEFVVDRAFNTVMDHARLR